MAEPQQQQQDDDPNLQWSTQLDTLLANWCDQAKCFEWMHNEAFTICNGLSQRFIIVMTILSAIAGTTNIITGSQSVYGFQVSWFFGGLSVLSSLGNILQDKLAYSQSAQAHKIYCAQWGQIRRQMESELILPYASRKDATSFMKMIRTAIDQVSNDGSSTIPKKIREECAKKFQGITNFNITDICGDVEHTQIFVAPVGAVAAVTTTTPLLQS